MKKAASLLNLQAGEEHQVILLALLSFSFGLTYFFAETAANTLFLLAFGAEQFVLIDLSLVVLLPLLGLVYNKLGQWLTATQLLIGNLTLLFVTLAGFYLLLTLSSAPWLVLALNVWYWIIVSLSTIALWSLAGQLFDVRQGKRLFGLIGAGMMLAAVVGGATLPWLIPLIGTLNLLLLAVLGMLAALIVLLSIIRHYGSQLKGVDHVETVPEVQRTSRLRPWWQERYIILLLTFVIITEVAFNLLHYAFLGFTDLRFPVEDQLAAFLGGFLSLTGLLTLLVQLGVAGRVLMRLGVGRSVQLLPATMFVFALLTAVLGIAAVPLTLLFSLTTLARLTDMVMRESVFRVVVQTLYQPLPARQQEQVLTAVEGFSLPVAAGIAVAIVVILRTFWTFSPVAMMGILAGTAVIWTILAVLLGQRAYPTALRQALTYRRLDEADLALHDASTIAILRQSLAREDPGVVIYALHRLEEAAPEGLAADLASLLNHPVTEVRLEALAKLEKLNIVAAATAVTAVLASETNPAVHGAALRTLAALSEAGAIETLRPYLASDVAEIQRGAIVGLLRYGGIEGILAAGQRLLASVQSPNNSERLLAAKILGEVGNHNFYTPLLPLLTDEDDEVRRVAVMAAARISNMRLWPLIIENLQRPAVRSAATSALIAGGEAVLPLLRDYFATAGWPLRRQLLPVYGRIGSPQASQLLLEQINAADNQIRTQAMRALHRCGFLAEERQTEQVSEQIEAEVQMAVWLLTALLILPDEKGIEQLQQAYRDQFQESRERLFLLLSFLYGPTVLQVQANLAHHSTAKQAYALETLDILLPAALKPVLFLLAPELNPAGQLEELKESMTLPVPDFIIYLQVVLTNENGRFSAWTRACALYAVGRLQVQALQANVLLCQADEDEIVRETAGWTLASLTADSDHKTKTPAASRQVITIEQVAFLRGIPLFSQVPDETLALVAHLTQTVSFMPGEHFIQQGAFEDSLYVIVEGEVDVLIDQQPVAKRYKQEVIGELAILDRRPRMASCVAATQTTALQICQSDFAVLMTENITLAQGIIRVLMQKIDQATQRSLIS
jgi:HEAT repeat protein